MGALVAWVPLDRGDADPARLWAHLIELTLIPDDFRLAENAGVDTGSKSFIDYRPDSGLPSLRPRCYCLAIAIRSRSSGSM